MSNTNAWKSKDGMAAIAALKEAGLLKHLGWVDDDLHPDELRILYSVYRDAARVFLVKHGRYPALHSSGSWYDAAILSASFCARVEAQDFDEFCVAAVLAVEKEQKKARKGD